MEEQTTALALPDEGQFQRDFEAINRFQKIVHASMVQGHDYGVIPGTQKPTLLKPGAEKIAKLLGLCDLYEVVVSKEDWDKPFFHYIVKCQLARVSDGKVISEGLGECNSLEEKYRYRWVFPSQLLEGTDKDKLVRRLIDTKRGKAMQYRLDNDQVFSLVNTFLKMAKKRALVDAALSAGRLSDLFTQDIEEIRGVVDGEMVPEETLSQSNGKLPSGKDLAEFYRNCFDKVGAKKDTIEHLLGMTVDEWLKSGKTLDQALTQVQDKIIKEGFPK